MCRRLLSGVGCEIWEMCDFFREALTETCACLSYALSFMIPHDPEGAGW